ncbi:acyl-CoA dehydrogenase family protein [Streptacidiphilus sp. N1-12]|uniref:Acyl-CoA dehydrogenase family protein n=2 Tax=Streptacidiphilus alkalitolerans TaxID=3342712 RepID=A0ABV6X2Q6_9ACTN
MNLELSEEQAAVRELAADFVNREIIPHSTAWDRAEQVDRGIVKKLGALGFLGLTIPEEYGGSGGDHLAYVLVTEELGRGDSSVRGLVSVSLGLVAKTINHFGTEQQKQQWLPRLTAGDALGCFALTEPGTGSDAGNLTTRAVRDGDEWVVNGAKMFITNGTWAEVALVFVRTGGDDPAQAGHRGVSAFLVPTDTPGLTRTTVHGKLGLRGQPTAELVFEDVRIPHSAMLGEEGRGFGVAMAALAKGRMSVGAGCVGLIQASLDAAVAYSTQREQFGKPIASHQLVQEMLADIKVELDAARMLVWRVADLIDRGQPFATEASVAKLFASEAAVKASNTALQVFGGYGFIDEYPVGKYVRDARVLTLYEGTSQIQKLLIGRALTGINAF